jgi:RNA polymerase sigma-70 factor (ECF subfamily)
MDERTDNQLIELYLSGDEKAFAALLHRHLALVVNFANTFVKNRQSAEDVAQEVFVKAWKNLTKFQADGNFKTWLLVIARNSSLDYLRKHKREVANVLSLENDFNDGGPDLEAKDDLPMEIFYKKEIKEMLENVLADFSAAEKMLVTLHYYEQLTFEEMAEILGESANTVKSRHRRLLVKLRRVLA